MLLLVLHRAVLPVLASLRVQASLALPALKARRKHHGLHLAAVARILFDLFVDICLLNAASAIINIEILVMGPCVELGHVLGTNLRRESVARHS